MTRPVDVGRCYCPKCNAERPDEHVRCFICGAVLRVYIPLADPVKIRVCRYCKSRLFGRYTKVCPDCQPLANLDRSRKSYWKKTHGTDPPPRVEYCVNCGRSLKEHPGRGRLRCDYCERVRAAERIAEYYHRKGRATRNARVSGDQRPDQPRSNGLHSGTNPSDGRDERPCTEGVFGKLPPTAGLLKHPASVHPH